MGESGFTHEALFYAGQESFLAGALPFIRGAVTSGEPVLVAVDEDKIRLLKKHLNGEADRVRFADVRAVARNPALITSIWKDFVAESTLNGGSCRGLGEPVWPERSDAELAECDHHESILNLAFEDGPAWQLMCPYDAERLRSHVLEAAHHNHPVVAEDRDVRSSRCYVHPVLTGAPFTGALPPPPNTAAWMDFESPSDLEQTREFVRDTAGDLGPDQIDGLVLAVDEVITNALRHGGAGGTLSAWRDDDRIVCEVAGAGTVSDPLAGRLRPSPDRLDGRGLWLANNVCDLVQVRSSAAGTVVRCHQRA
jgi:anti-sigma regulatory factor (Ser/Thr protein kinase)